jgi:pimeloyl-ACP methyl ester carboxylesterase
MITPRKPVVFIHGLWLHSTSWQNWVDLFGEEGYDPIVPEWPGVPDTVAEARANPESQAGKGIDDVVNHYAEIIRGLEGKPVVIGHSFGGLFTQRLLGQDLAAGAVAIDPAPIRGVLVLPPAQLRSAFPGLRNPANRKRTVSLTPKQFRYAFANAVSERESAELYEAWAIPGPGRPLFEAAFANFSPNSPAKVNTRNSSRGPLLLISGKQDHTVPDVVTRSTFKQYRHSTAVTDLEQIHNRGHSLTIDSGWRDVANIALNWLKTRGL